MKDDKLMKLAKKRVYEMQEFYIHLVICVAVSVMLLIIYFVATPGWFFWPILPMIGLVVSFVAYVPSDFPLFNIFKIEDKVQAEYERLKQRYNNENNNKEKER